MVYRPAQDGNTMSAADELLVSKWRESVRSPDMLQAESFQIRDLAQSRVVFNPGYVRPIPAVENPSVFQSYNEEEANLNLPSAPPVVCWVDLLNEQVVEDPMDLVEEFKEGCNEDLSEAPHPLVIPEYPAAQGHFILPLFKDECLPQVISPELLTMVLNVFRVSENPTLRLGYDSLGAGACYNHLHFHLLFLDQLQDMQKFPVERLEKTLLLTSSLQHKSPGEIDMFSQGIRLFEVRDPNRTCLVVTPSTAVSSSNISEVTESVSNVAGTIVNHLIEQNLPHNLLIADQGTVVYIFIRQPAVHVSFFELAGLVLTARSQDLNMQDADVNALFSSVKAADSDFAEVRDYIVTHLRSIYKTS